MRTSTFATEHPKPEPPKPTPPPNLERVACSEQELRGTQCPHHRTRPRSDPRPFWFTRHSTSPEPRQLRVSA